MERACGLLSRGLSEQALGFALLLVLVLDASQRCKLTGCHTKQFYVKTDGPYPVSFA